MKSKILAIAILALCAITASAQNRQSTSAQNRQSTSAQNRQSTSAQSRQSTSAQNRQSTSAQNSKTTNQSKQMKSIVIYFSRSGNNYVNGDIVNLPVGNTKLLAEKIQKQTGCDSFEIVPVKAYSADYTKCTQEAKDELNKNARPAYKGTIDLSDYDTIYLGYPIWWGTFPMCVFKFIEDHDGFAGKTVLPYSTHEGSGLGSSISDLKRLCPKATVKKGVAIKGSSAKTADISKIISQ